ncbi:MAG: hypothetical protein ACJ796_02310 [Gemmatimonadaceae bacterium]
MRAHGGDWPLPRGTCSLGIPHAPVQESNVSGGVRRIALVAPL